MTRRWVSSFVSPPSVAARAQRSCRNSRYADAGRACCEEDIIDHALDQELGSDALTARKTGKVDQEYFVAFNCGSVPEVIDHGAIGYICEDVQSAIRTLQHLNERSRTEILAQFERRFGARTMAQKCVDSFGALRHGGQRTAILQTVTG